MNGDAAAAAELLESDCASDLNANKFATSCGSHVEIDQIRLRPNSLDWRPTTHTINSCFVIKMALGFEVVIRCEMW